MGEVFALILRSTDWLIKEGAPTSGNLLQVLVQVHVLPFGVLGPDKFSKLAYIWKSQDDIALSMLDSFEIFTTNGVVHWKRSSQSAPPAHVINSLISDVLIEEKIPKAKLGSSAATNPHFQTGQYTLRWAVEKELGIFFVVGSEFRSLVAVMARREV